MDCHAHFSVTMRKNSSSLVAASSWSMRISWFATACAPAVLLGESAAPSDADAAAAIRMRGCRLTFPQQLLSDAPHINLLLAAAAERAPACETGTGRDNVHGRSP